MRIIIQAIKATLLTTAFATLLINCKAQGLDGVRNSFIKQSAFQEKIFVHTDKSTYLPGEILWFKIYCVDGNNHKPANLSKVVYADLLDNNQNSVLQAKISLVNGVGNGSLYIPVSVSSGNYKLRAYTNWMKNFSPDYYFEKIITLVNPLKSPEAISEIKSAPTYDVQFFPEGGNLVGGIKSKVAFKAVGQNGNGVKIIGVIVNQRNDTIARIGSLKFGMGSFSFTPAVGGTYRAVMKEGNNKIFEKALPEVMALGYAMELTEESGRLDIAVKSNTNEGNVYLFAHTGQVVKTATSVSFVNGIAHFTINKNDLGDGITHLTVFNSAKQPVCERLYFKRPTRQLLIEAAADQQQYIPRKKVNVNVLAKDIGGKASAADLSMSVYRVDSLQDIDQSNIFNYLWLNADLRGYIESPEYYFKATDEETNEALDNLMLTQGWRRFQWSQVLENKQPAFAFSPEFYGHTITGKIVNATTGLPAKEILTYLGVPGKRVQLYTSESDSLGRLFYYTKGFFGPSEIIAQTNGLIDSTYRIDIASPFSEQYSKTLLHGFTFVPAMQRALQDHSLSTQVLNIYSGSNIKRFYDALVDSEAFYGKPYKTYKLDDFTRFTTMEEDLREYVSEDNIVKSKVKFHIKVLGERGFLDGDPLVLLDGIPMFNIDKVIALDPLKLRKLEVVNERYYYGPAEHEGVFSFTSYKGDLGGVDLDAHAVVLDYEGLQLRREFYSPVYDTEAQAKSRMPDLRNLLYWAPSVSTQGKDAVSFFTSDQPGKYVGVVQGINADGQAGVQYFTFEVK
jgi:hypothetical protein